MKKNTLIIHNINHDVNSPEDNDMLRAQYGYNFALLQGDGGLNTKIAFMKLLRMISGAELKPTKEAVDKIIAIITSLGSADDIRTDIIDQVSKMDGAQLRSLQRHISTAFGSYADHAMPTKHYDHLGLDEHGNPKDNPF